MLVITTTSLSGAPLAPPKSFMVSVPELILNVSFPVPPVIISSPPLPVKISAPAPPVRVSPCVPPTKEKGPEAADTSIVLPAPFAAVKIALLASDVLFLVSLVAVKPIISTASSLAVPFITTTSSSLPAAPPKSFTVSVPESIVIMSLPAPPVIISSPP